MMSKFYKCCAVPQCASNTSKTPEKLFIHVPRSKDRKIWLQLARRDPALVATQSKMYFCEDHFDLPTDMENYTEYHLMGSVSQVRIRAGCLPKKFGCQPDRKRRTDKKTARSLVIKRQRLEAISECEREIEARSTQSISMVEVQPGPSSDIYETRKMEQLCRLCLSYLHDLTTTAVFLFSSESGEEIADIVMECAPVQITRYDKMPTYICLLCFAELKKFHQFQMQVIQSDKTLQRHVQQLADCSTQIKVERDHEEGPSDNSVSQNTETDVTTRCEAFEISPEFDFYSKQTPPVNFNAENSNNEEMLLKTEIKDEPIDYNSFVSSESAEEPVASLSKVEDSEINCEDSMITIGDTKVDVKKTEFFEYSFKIENDTAEEIPLKLEEATNKPLEQVDSSLVPQNFRTDPSVGIGEKQYECDVCKMCFKQAVYLKRHKLRHTGEKPYQCGICKMRFRHTRTLLNHKLTHTGEKPFQCDICQMTFRQTIHLKNHKLKHTGEKPYQCDICQISFRESRLLKSHKQKHTGEKPYKCDICQKCFTRRASLNNHKVKHTREKLHQCDICQMCFRLAGQLKIHKLIHKREKPYRCNICDMCFKHPSALKNHELLHTGEKPFQCDICQMSFRQTIHLKNHKLTHTGEKPHQCEFCQMCFRQECQLKCHRLTHTVEKLYECDICQMCFKQAAHLKSHKLIHTGKKLYQCDICQMCFKESRILQSHNLIHTGEKPYECDVCKMCFRHLYTLRNHELIHKGEKPYQCDICQMSFRQSCHLKSHKLKHTGEKPYQCNICQMVFRHSNSLRIHELRHME